MGHLVSAFSEFPDYLFHPFWNWGYQFWSGIGSDFGELSIVGSLIGMGVITYRHVECHQDGCHRLGRFHHGHLKLCHIHHPKTPNHGKITDFHINEVTQDHKEDKKRLERHHREHGEALRALHDKIDRVEEKAQKWDRTIYR